MDNARKNIMRISKLLYIVAKLVVIFMIISMVVVTTLSLCSIFIEHQELHETTLKILKSEGSLSMIGFFNLHYVLRYCF